MGIPEKERFVKGTFVKGTQVSVAGEIAEVFGESVIIRTETGRLAAADMTDLREQIEIGGGVTFPGPDGSALYDVGDSELAEPQLSFTVTKHWALPAGQSGFTEMTCSRAPLWRVLMWILEELPEGSVVFSRHTHLAQEGTRQIYINWDAAPEGVKNPVIPRPSCVAGGAATVPEPAEPER